MKPNQTPVEVFSRSVKLELTADTEIELSFTATQEERCGIAGLLGLDSLEDLSGSAVVRRLGDGETVSLHVNIQADVIQSCVVTLEPVASKLNHTFSRLYRPGNRLEESPVSEDGEVVVDIDGEDPAELLPGEQLDFGVIVVEELALILDPYPRTEGAAEGEDAQGELPSAEGETRRPFSGLRNLVGGG